MTKIEIKISQFNVVKKLFLFILGKRKSINIRLKRILIKINFVSIMLIVDKKEVGGVLRKLCRSSYDVRLRMAYFKREESH